ncbi:MAG: trypsin-like peptidase domain-containing protein [Patescibacteria group bacterium]|nr:trypsin-like peptidase domain-containing protein [Patescibacteria group bacterium]MDD5121134.1 trypsin-like peptidase domain-containing protein [Patescibacteria group bacterium]MDD5221649.1 trypsin-like peptidase domain-containing protein [Patescibacteria group bacterium]MDD5395947.1 trypsin-like peptidase domain-containing protein [Patescibacteria group bacterium]
MKKQFTIILTSLFILSLFAIPHGFVYADCAYNENLPPQITDVTPTEIRLGYSVPDRYKAGAPDLIINGNNLLPPCGSHALELDGQGTGNIEEWSNSQIKVPNELLYRALGANSFMTSGSYEIKNIKLIYYYGEENRWVYLNKDVSIRLLPVCYYDLWTCSDFGPCEQNGTKNRTCTQTFDCPTVNTGPAVETTQSCNYVPPCTSDTWSCGDWSTCASYGSQSRTCSKTFDCPTAYTSSPSTSQSCTPPRQESTCNADTWSCGNWGACSPQGIQTRSCNKVFDCSSAETASPATSQYCVAPNQPALQSPTENLGIVNQNLIIKSTVKLICPVDKTMASQGSGTIIDSKGTILTNKHVIDGTLGCLVCFVDNYNNEPYCGDRQIADIYKVSSDIDVALLKLRNQGNKSLTFVSIIQGNSDSLRLGDTLTTYGYPAKFGTKINYTSGAFSGVDGNYLKTQAILDSGNSGGGAYLKNGTFVGIPSKVFLGNFTNMGGILSINKINSWLNNSPMAYDNGGSNNYSRVSSILDNIDLTTLGSLSLFIADSSKTSSNVGDLINGTLARVKGTAGVYLIYNNQKRPIKSATVFLGRGYKWKDVVDVDVATLSAYPTGPDLTISEQINTTPDSQTFNIKATVPGLRVRSLPSLSGKIITSILNKKIYSVIDQQNGWYKIYYVANKAGWVMSQYAKIVK